MSETWTHGHICPSPVACHWGLAGTDTKKRQTRGSALLMDSGSEKLSPLLGRVAGEQWVRQAGSR